MLVLRIECLQGTVSGPHCLPVLRASDAKLTTRAVCEFSYAQSKAAERHLTQLMSAALQPFNIRVNCVCPGLFPSGLTINQEGKLHAPMQEATKVIPKG